MLSLGPLVSFYFTYTGINVTYQVEKADKRFFVAENVQAGFLVILCSGAIYGER